MTVSVPMPDLGESVTEVTVSRWLKEVGEYVDFDEPLLEVSTDKVDTEIPSPVAGTLARIVAGEEEVIAIGGEVAVIEEGSSSEPEAESAPEPEPEPVRAPEPAPEPQPEPVAQAAPPAPEPHPASAPAATAPTASAVPDCAGTEEAMPRMRRVSAQRMTESLRTSA